MDKVKKDFVIGAFFLLLGAAYFISAFSIGSYKGYGSQNISSSFVPKLLGVLLMVLSATLLFQTYNAWRRITDAMKRDPGLAAGTEPGHLFFRPGELRSVLAVFGVLAMYVALLEPVGFILTSCVFLFVTIKIMAPDGKFDWRFAALLSVIVPPVVYVLFVYGLDMLLPEGILG